MPRAPGGGRPPKPVEQHRLLGNPSKKKLPEPVVSLPGITKVPDAPEGLEPRGMRLWTEAWTWGAPWLSPALDAGTLEQACRLTDEVEKYRQLTMRAPLLKEPIVTPTGRVVTDDDGQPLYKLTANPAEKMLRRAEVSLRGLLTDLAFTPTARARLGLAQVKTQTKLEALLTQRRDRGVGATVVDATAVSK